MPVDAANSPTLTFDGTKAGVILGTAAHMSPEQARGKPADRRSDIFSFGAVVYELLTGGPAFTGGSVADLLSAVLNKEPDWSKVPASIRGLLQWCMEKDRRQRLQAIGDARRWLDAGRVCERTGWLSLERRASRQHVYASLAACNLKSSIFNLKSHRSLVLLAVIRVAARMAVS